MKRILVLLLSGLIILISLSGCSKSEIATMVYYPQYAYFETTEELMNTAAGVFEGKVVNISFIAMDRNEVVVTDSTLDTPFDKDSATLLTVYEISTQITYKGDIGETMYIIILGGLEGYKEDEQKDFMRKTGISERTEILQVSAREDMPEIGESYLFVVRKGIDENNVFAISAWQFFYEIAPKTTAPDPTIDEDPFKVNPYEPTYQSIIDYFNKLN